MDAALFKIMDSVSTTGSGDSVTGIVLNVKMSAGEWWYYVASNYCDGYYTDPEGTIRYESNRINRSGRWLPEKLLTEV